METFSIDSFEWWHLPVVFFAGLIGETYGCIVGGGGLVVQPALLFVGLPIHQAIATDIACSIGSELGIIHSMGHRLKKNIKLTVIVSLSLFLGGIIGTHLLHTVGVDTLVNIMVVAVIALLAKFIFVSRQTPDLANDEINYHSASFYILVILCFFIGIYSNCISLGEGTFFRLAAISTLGFSFIAIHGIRSLGMLFIRGYSLYVTIQSGFLAWPHFIALFISTFIAGKLATRIVFKAPEKYLRILLAIVAFSFLCYLIYTYKLT